MGYTEASSQRKRQASGNLDIGDQEEPQLGSCDFISSTEGAKECLAGIPFPAGKQEILAYIERNNGPEAVVVAANQIPDKVYKSMDELLQYLEAK